MTSTEAGVGFDGPRGKTHHQQRTCRSCPRMRNRWSSEFHHHLAEVLFIQYHAIPRGVAIVGSRYELGADGYLSCEADDAGADLVFYEVRDGEVDVAWICGM
jgi:hypothetical protein